MPAYLRQCSRVIVIPDNTSDLPASPESTTATTANDTAVLATDSDPAIASQKVQTSLAAIQNWFKKLRNKGN
jgi:hypothetical protein